LKRRMPMYALPGVVAVALAILTGCATLSPEEREARRAELDQMGDETVAALLETKPQLREVLDESVGYAVVDMKVTKIPVFGAGGGYGVVVDKRTNTRSYIKVSRFEIGGGLGAQKFKVIVIFEDGKLLDRAASGAWHYEAGAEAAAGTASTEGHVTKSGKGYHAYKFAEGGAVATVTIRMAYAKPYLD
jgi:lipid-binding SYLF domain-containing protein